MGDAIGRPHGDGPASGVPNSAISARRTRAEVDRTIEAWFWRVASQVGYRAGFEAGRDQVLTAIIDGQDDTHRRLSGLAREPVWAELEQMRREPGGPAWVGAMTARGGEEYSGGPVPAW